MTTIDIFKLSMKLKILSFAFLLISITSCQSRKASDFRETIDQQERVAFNIVVGKDGPEEKKLQYLIKDDYKGALAAVDQQAAAFDKLIEDIKALPADGIEQGGELKNAAINYYTALKALHFYDKKEIVQREAIVKLKGEALQPAQRELIELAVQKKALYQNVYKQERMLHEASKKFNTANRI